MKRPRTSAADAPLSFVVPCLAQAVAEPPSGDQWVHEIKYDGYRVQAIVQAGRVTLLTRRGLDWTNRFGIVVTEFAQVAAQSAIVDCEAIVQGNDSVANFHALQQEIKKGKAARILLMAFDLLHLDGQDLRPQPLLLRKAALRRLLGDRPKSSLLQFSEHMKGDGQELLEGACRLGLEGIVSKRIDKPYRSGRNENWTKVKCLMADPFVVVGFVPSKAASEAIGSLVLGFYEGTTLVYAGRVGTGFSATEAGAIWEALQSIFTDAPPLARSLTREQLDGVVWVHPMLVAQIEYRAWTSDHILRHSTFKAFREDKLPTQIHAPASMRRP